MGFSFAVLLSIISKRHRNPRLKDFRAKLEKKAPKELTLFQYPAKMMFWIIVILLFGICLQWFAIEFRKDLQELQKSTVERHQPLKQAHSDRFSLNKVSASIENIANTENKQLSEQNSIAFEKVRKLINFFHLLEIIGIIALIMNLKFRAVKINKRTKTIEVIDYINLGLRTKKQYYQVKEGDKIEIWQMGESRFTNTNYYYSIRIISYDHSWQVIKKSNIYTSRTTTIELGYIYSLPYTTKIINMTKYQAE